MEKNGLNAPVYANTNKTAASRGNAATGGRLSTFMWLSRFFSMLCFGLILSCSVLALSLIHIAKEAEVDSVLVTAPTYSDNLAYFEPLHADMPMMNILAEMFVRQYVTIRNNVWPNVKEMQIAWGPGGVIRHMSTWNVYDDFWNKEARKYFSDKSMEHPPAVMIDTDIKKIFKDGWNSWQIFFDTRKMDTTISSPVIEHWLATIQFRYYASNAIMASRLRNPLGFTVTQYHLARQKQ
ncbi:MAG: type IV secretion system protein [Alphaproteobacteria bacterium]|nr:type IV secretion system protein [Alphaproteobacteria bacterium]